MDSSGYTYRTTLALHISQDEIPLVASTSSSLAQAGPSSERRTTTYGPLPLSADTPTPLQRLSQLHLHEESEFDYLCAPLTNGNWQQRWENMCVATPPSNETGGSSSFDKRRSRSMATMSMADASFTNNEDMERLREAELWRSAGAFRRGEVNATRSEETGLLIAMASEWLELDSDVEGIRFDSELALKQEVAYASHLHIQNLILPAPRNPQYLADYARCLADILQTPGFLQFSIRIPISDPSAPYPTTSIQTWDMWNTIRAMCDYNPRLSVTLDLGYPLSSLPILTRWHAEPIKFIFLPASAYLSNAKGYPVLSKSCQAFFKSIFKFKPVVILGGIHKGVHSSGGPEAYASYIRFLERKTPVSDPLEQFAGSYMDYLQAPLQPLMDNLENDTYEGFERDPVKYRQYEEAIYQALCDRAADNNSNNNRPTIIFVCGAGRGPLVEGCIRAARRADKPISLTAVEKNPNAFVILQERKAVEWGDAVDLVFSDMRSFRPAVQADIIVSELLGSFGDNELSPECLDGVMRCLAPGGVSIPCSYTSYLAPVASSKLHSEVSNATDTKYPEQPYVVMFQAHTILSEQGGRENWPKFADCWGFDHPRNDVVCDEVTGLPLTNHHNARSAHVTFHVPNGGICHGFAGYFEAQLYNDVGISIHPERMDPNMLSWFPLFFPFKEPLYLPPRSELDAHIFRLVDGNKKRVWFEWGAEVYLPLPAHTMVPSPTNASSVHTTATTGLTATSNANANANGGPSSASAFSSSHADAGAARRQHQRASSPIDMRSTASQMSAVMNASNSSSAHHPSYPYPSPTANLDGGSNNNSGLPLASPFIGNESMSSSAGFMLDALQQRSQLMNGEGIVRLKVGQTKLHNPGGRSSWVGL